MLPGYGSELVDLIDSPLNDSTKLLMHKTIFESILQWEPRLNIRQIQDVSQDTDGQLTITITGIFQENEVTIAATI